MLVPIFYCHFPASNIKATEAFNEKSRNPPGCILDTSVFENFKFADESFEKSLETLKIFKKFSQN